MKKVILLTSLIYVFTGVAGQTTYSKEIIAEIKQVENGLTGRYKIDGKTYNILDRMAYYKIKGLSIAVVRNYTVIWAKGYGWADKKENRPVTTATLFEPGSISKSLNAVGVLKLVQDNKLDPNKDINDYLKSWKFPYDSLSKGKKITLSHLLSHTAGLSVHGFPGYDPKSKIPLIVEVLDGKTPANTAPVRSEFEPGLRFQYSGGGTTITQLIVTDVTRQAYDVFMYNNVLKPMGMLHSFYTQPPSKGKLKNVATGYSKDGIEIRNKFHVYPEQAAAGLWTTPTDLCKYIIETQLAYIGKSSKVLNQEITQLRLTPYIDKSSALGIFFDERNGTKYFLHGASNEGFSGLYYGSLEGGNGVAMFVNSDNANIFPELLNSVVSVYNWKGFDKPEAINPINISDTLTQKYIGVYLIEKAIAEVTQKQGKLYFWGGGDLESMYFTSDKDFVNGESLVRKSFLTDSAENTIGYARRRNGEELPSAIKIHRVDTIKASIGQINSFGWHLLEEKRFDDAILYLNRGIQLEPNDFAVRINLGHAYLFKHEYDKALQLYKASMNLKPNSKSSSKSMIIQDFDYLKKIGFDKTLIDKAGIELNL